MASYGLKYWWQKYRDGVAVRLEIQQRDYSGSAKEIYALQSLSLKLQGSDDSIDVPIIKTSLDVGLVDAIDIPDTSTVKYGDWTEFFTPDSTLYRFVVKQGGTTRWTGYLTPDSYEEDLTFRSTIHLTARDNIGHLQDFIYDHTEFDDEMVSLGDLIARAEELMDFPMTTVKSFMMEMTDAEDNSITDYLDHQMFNTFSFDGKDWYEVLESVLDGLGLVMRYIDDNRCMICHLRALPLMGKTGGAPSEKDIRFLSSSGHRMMTPGAKQISEVFTYDKTPMFSTELDSSDDFEAETISIEGETISTYGVSRMGSWRASGNIGCLNNYYHSVRVGRTSSRSLSDPETIYISAYTSSEEWGSHSFRISRNVNAGNVISMSFSISSRLLTTSGSESLCTERAATSVTMHYSILFTSSAETLYYDGEQWGGTEHIMSARVDGVPTSGREDRGIGTLDVNHELSSPGKGKIRVHVHGFSFSVSLQQGQTIEGLVKAGTYCEMSGFVMEQKNIDGYSERKTTTIYDERYNQTISRSPGYGQVPATALASVFVNGIYAIGADYPPITGWGWNDRADEGSMPLAMVVHKQILMYHSSTSNILTGTISDVTAGDPRFNDIYIWQGRKFLLAGGALDLLSGHLEGVTLRDYVSYEDLWPLGTAMRFDRVSLDVPASGVTVTVGVVSNVDWAADAYLDGESLTVTPSRGSGNATLKLTIPANTSASELEGHIRLVDLGLSAPEVFCQIRQAAAEAVLTIDPEDLVIPYMETTGNIDVDTNDSGWSVESGASWITASRDTPTRAVVRSVDTNSGRGSTERTGSVTVKAGAVERTASVRQTAPGGLMFSGQTSYTAPASGGQVVMSFVTNAKTLRINITASRSLESATVMYSTGDDLVILGQNDNPAAMATLLPDTDIPGDPGLTEAYALLLQLDLSANTGSGNAGYIISISIEDGSEVEVKGVTLVQEAEI